MKPPGSLFGFSFNLRMPFPSGRTLISRTYFDIFSVQFVTQYQQAGGRFRLRATTLCGGWHSEPNNQEMIVKGFDQEAAAVLMARVAVHRTETEEVKWETIHRPQSPPPYSEMSSKFRFILVPF